MNRRPNSIRFAKLPPIGLAVLIADQRFELVAHEPHTTRTGKSTLWLVWTADCATCGREFVSRSPEDSLATVRRCEDHRRPGQRVTRQELQA